MDVFIGNLPLDFTQKQLRKKFERFGEVKALKIVSDKVTGHSLGFGFVKMRHKDEAIEAIEHLNRSRMGSRLVMVCEASRRIERREALIEHYQKC